tara:strand:+ start:344 stop:592 length:249 start_codon:yes stop_codon:yes gene_type:complete
MKKLAIRLNAAIKILFSSHWVILRVEQNDLGNMLLEEDYDIKILFHGLQPYGVWRIIKDMANEKDDLDMLLDKAQFEAEAEL